jgi:hypothetical protein
MTDQEFPESLSVDESFRAAFYMALTYWGRGHSAPYDTTLMSTTCGPIPQGGKTGRRRSREQCRMAASPIPITTAAGRFVLTGRASSGFDPRAY